ncbi:MAG: hypothetical protein K2R98_14225 [Gemmataceae bacterium]|nr:hypothetical protein [Gemmataceae bacterium]
MRTIEIVNVNGTQVVKLPAGFHFETNTVSIRKEGNTVILEPIKPAAWPPGFFDRIRIDEPTFVRPPQGQVPPAPSLD